MTLRAELLPAISQNDQETINFLALCFGMWYNSKLSGRTDMDGFPSGQRGQTVNLLQIASVVRIHLHPVADIINHILYPRVWRNRQTQGT